MTSRDSTPHGNFISIDYFGTPFNFLTLMEGLPEDLLAQRGQLLVGCATTSRDEPRAEGWFRPFEGDSDAIGKIVCNLNPDIGYTPEFFLSVVTAYLPQDAISALWPTWERIHPEIELDNDAILAMQAGEEPASDTEPSKRQEIETGERGCCVSITEVYP